MEQVTDYLGKPVEPTLWAINRALEVGGLVEVGNRRTGSVRLGKSIGNEAMDRGRPSEDVRYHVDDQVGHPSEFLIFKDIKEAYARFRFLVNGYFQTGLPPI